MRHPPDSSPSRRYEKRLSESAAVKNLMLGIRMQAKLALDRGIDLRAGSTALPRRFGDCSEIQN
jgi:hypothetical protein